MQDNARISSFVDDEDGVRSDTYAILASLLSATPSRDLIDYLCHIEAQEGETGDVGEAWQGLKTAAGKVDPEKLDDEFHDLFIGMGRGQVVPYGSWHITGFLMDKPLSDLRNDLKKLGFVSPPDQKDPEDHIAALCETMSILIISSDIEGYQQRRFFIHHIHPWADRFFKELQAASCADFYQSVGLLGERFMQLENQYLNIQDH